MRGDQPFGCAAPDALGPIGSGGSRRQRDRHSFSAMTTPLRQALVYRLACHSLCARCRDDRAFRRRTDELLAKFQNELPAILREAAALERELAESVSAR
jgi:hypothetical protein